MKLLLGTLTWLLATGLATAQLPAVVELRDLVGIEHGLLTGGVDTARVGLRLSPAGDINGDGFADLLVSAESYVPGGKAGAVYLVFGGPGVLSEAGTDLSVLNGVDGTFQYGQGVLDYLGWGATPLGDFNGDGYDDLAFGSYLLNGGAGGAYVLFGGPDVGGDGTIDLTGFDGTTGFVIEGTVPGSRAGASVAGIGDFNQDGSRDIVIGVERAGELETFTDKTDYAVLVGGDLDGDGDEDLVAVYSYSQGITSWFNDGAGNYSLVQSLPIPDLFPWFGRLADVDGDGDLDLLYTGVFTAAVLELRVVFNPGNGDLSGVPVIYPVSACWAPFELEDLDADGDLDVVVASFDANSCNGGGGRNLEVFLNDGAGGLSALPVVPLAGDPGELRFGDLDGDADPDLLVGYDNASGLELLINDGAGGFTSLLGLDPGTSHSSFTLGDVDGDLDTDIFGSAGSELLVYLNDGTGSFSPPVKQEGGIGKDNLTVDLNGDGYPDLVGRLQESLLTAINRGDGTFAGGMEYAGGNQDVLFTVLDINGDGLPGVATIERNSGDIHLLPSLGLGLLNGSFRGDAYVVFGGPGVGSSGVLSLGDLDGTNGFMVQGPNGGARFGADAVGLEDINGDGVPDLAISAPDAHVGIGKGGGVLVLFGGAGVGAAGVLHWTDIDGTNGFVVPGVQLDGYLGSSLGAGDVNGDMLSDLIIGADLHDVGSYQRAGQVFALLGAPGIGAGGTFDLSGIDGSNGHVLEGFLLDGKAGKRVQSGGDFNGDGTDDILIGAPEAMGADGQAFLVYGGASLAGQASLALDTLDGSNGTLFVSAGANDSTGRGVGFIGDLDHDGADEIAIGAPNADRGGNNDGLIYVFSGLGQSCADSIGDSYCVAVPNSRGVGAAIAAQGSEFVNEDCLRLWALFLPYNKLGYFIGSQSQGFVSNPGGSQGNLCLGGSIVRFAAQVQDTGDVGWMSIDVDLASIPLLAGETWNFQGWFRDQNPGNTSNFTDGLTTTFQ
jgi:FG-GAP-like repeat/FG-GAP repeat